MTGRPAVCRAESYSGCCSPWPRAMPDLLVLDEPVSGVDRAGLRDFYALLDDLKATADMVILLVSHDLDFVRKSADRVVLLDKTVLACGKPEEVFETPAFAAAFSGRGGTGPA